MKKDINEESVVKNNYFIGIIGAILGGLVASIPWILMYVYGNMMLSALSIIIGAGVFYGYKLFGGKVTKSLPVIIVIISVLVTVFTMLILIPIFLLHSEGIHININTIKYLYEDINFLKGISSDVVIATIFSIFGAIVIAINVKKKFQSEKTENVELDNPVTTEENTKNKVNSKVLTILIGTVFICIMIGVVIYNQIKNTTPQEISDDVISFTIDSEWVQGVNDYENEWVYYRYLNNNYPKEINDDDSQYPANIDIIYFENDIEKIPDIETLKQNIKESMLSEEIQPETCEENIETTLNGYNVLKMRMLYKTDYDSIEYAYYILKDNYIAVIDAFCYNLDEETELKESIDKITESFKWLE